MLAETLPILPCPTRSLSVRSSFKVSAAQAREGSMVRVYSSRQQGCLEEGLQLRLRQRDYSIMKLVADDNGRLACKILFTPRKAFSAERQADGMIRLIEPIAHPSGSRNSLRLAHFRRSAGRGTAGLHQAITASSGLGGQTSNRGSLPPSRQSRTALRRADSSYGLGRKLTSCARSESSRMISGL